MGQVSEKQTFIDVRIYIEVDRERAKRYAVPCDTPDDVMEEVTLTVNEWEHGVWINDYKVLGFGSEAIDNGI